MTDEILEKNSDICGDIWRGADGGLRKWKRPILTMAYCLWNSGIAIFISGCLVGGIITISGRSFAYGPCYWATGLIFLVTAVAAGAVPAKGRKIL